MAVWLTPPAVPVTVTVYKPLGVDEPTVKVRVEDPEPGAAIDVGLNAAVVPVGSPEALNATAELKPPAIVALMVLVPLEPCTTITVPGEAAMANVGPVTVRVTVAVWDVPLPVPVTTTE